MHDRIWTHGVADDKDWITQCLVPWTGEPLLGLDRPKLAPLISLGDHGTHTEPGNVSE